jgi:uncharacterized protein YwgA
MNMVSQNAKEETAKKLTAKELVLLVLELAGGRIITDTRMQKLAFLVNQEVFKWVKFEANDYGPYSKELMKAVYKLENEGKLIYVWDNDGLSKYYLTEKGKKNAEKLLERLKAKAEDEDKLKRAMEIIQRHKDDPIPKLIAYIYKYYPEYAEKSKIKDKVEEWIRYYHL